LRWCLEKVGCEAGVLQDLWKLRLARGKVDSTWGKRQSSGGHKKKNREKLCPKGSFK
jgi:hypothetical protein